MLAENPPQTQGDNLAQAVERQIAHRTWGQIRQLRVEKKDGCLVVQGLTRSYYAKQLAIQAVLEALGEADATPLAVDIQVLGHPA